MPTNLTNQYLINTEYSTYRYPGTIGSIISRQYRFCAFECTALANLPCGVFVTMSADAMAGNKVKPLSAANDKVFGVSMYNGNIIYDFDAATQNYIYPKDSIVSLIEEGDVFMFAEKAVAAGDDVYARHTADAGNTRIGALSNAAGTGLVLIPGAKFLKAIASPGVTQVSLPDLI